jgi:hypothetical protein
MQRAVALFFCPLFHCNDTHKDRRNRRKPVTHIFNTTLHARSQQALHRLRAGSNQPRRLPPPLLPRGASGADGSTRMPVSR